jgi:hypothetical protein
MNYKQKAGHRFEMLGCAKIARGYAKYGKPKEALPWFNKAAEHLFKLGGLMGNW